LARVLSFIEGTNISNSLNFNYEYNDLSGGNMTGCSAVVNVFLCPSAVRVGSGTRDTPNLTNSPEESALGGTTGYGVFDYAPVIYTDINVINGVVTAGGVGSSPAVPYRNKPSATSGMLKNGKTAIAEITDGTSNTIALIECAGRDDRYVSQYADGYVANTPIGYPFPSRGSGVSTAGPHRFWRWADQGGANEEAFSYHPGGVNALLGDGSVRFIKSTINLAAFRSLVTLSGGEVISSDSL
jgi:prepilin-type processing-associated H-X9-DG protein